MAAHPLSEDAWTRARNRFIEDLTPEEIQLYRQASPEEIFYDASAAVKRHGASSMGPGLMNKLRPFIDAIEQYSQALDVYSNTYPLALSPLWGSVRVLLVIAREFGKYFEKLVDMLARIGDVLPQYQVYERLFPDHERLTQALSVVYVDVIHFCSDVKAVFRRGQRPSMTSLKVAFKLVWKPFESQFGQQLENFRNHRKNVEKEAGLSHMVEAAEARALARINNLQVEKMNNENEHRRIIERITSIDVETKHRKLQNLRFHGTGEWLLQNENYLEWKCAANSSSLCCCGIPGSGKSILVSRIIDDLSVTATGSQVAIVYYYCDYADQLTLQTDQILASVLKQLIPGDLIPKDIHAQILRAYKDSTRTPGTHELTELICSSMQLHPTVYIVLDGLDECDRIPRQEILGFLERLTTLAKTHVHTFISCRDEDQLLRALKSYPRIQLTAAAVANDINSFVEGSVKSRIKSGQLTIRNPDLEHQIVRDLVDKAHGMFLWIYFQLNDLCEALSDAMVRQTLRDLPVGLVQTYERILLKISKSPLAKREFALRVFRWTVCSRRPMKAEELQEAVAFESSDRYWDSDKIPDENLMIETCRGLLVRDEEDRTVRFAHHTVQQYLLSAPTVRPPEGLAFSITPRPEAETFVGQVCVTYLCFSDFETQIALRTPNVKIEPVGVLKEGGLVRMPAALGIGKLLTEIPYRLLGGKPTAAPLNIDYSAHLGSKTQKPPPVHSSLRQKYRLLEYIIEHWMDHTRELNPALDARFRNLVLHKTLSFEFRPWGPNRHFGPHGCASCHDHVKSEELPYMSLFHYSAQVGHWNLMESLVADYCQHEVPLNETLLIASRHGQELIVQNLMQRFKFDISDGRAVYVAVAAGHTEVVRCFLIFSERWAEINFHESIHNAAEHGRLKILRILNTNRIGLKDRARQGFLLRSLCSLDTEGDSPLHKAARNGHSAVVELILEHFSEPDPRNPSLERSVDSANSEGFTALHLAARGGHLKVIRDLSNHWAVLDRERRADDEWTALHFAAAEGHKAVVEFLLQKGANDYVKAKDGTMPIQLAIKGGHVGAARALLRHLGGKRSLSIYRPDEFIALIEATDGEEKEPVLCAFLCAVLDPISDSDIWYLRDVLETAKYMMYNRTVDLLTSLLQELSLDRVTEERLTQESHLLKTSHSPSTSWLD